MRHDNGYWIVYSWNSGLKCTNNVSKINGLFSKFYFSFYRFVVEVLKGLQGQSTSTALTFVNMMKKNVLKDRKQVKLEAETSEVQELCEKWRT